MKAFILTLTNVLCIASLLMSQDMNRDLEIAENILASSIKNTMKNDGFYFPSSFEVTGNYSEQIGAVFSVKTKNMFFQKAGQQISKVYYDLTEGDNRVRKGRATRDDIQLSLQDAAMNFLADYGHMIRGLDDDQKVIVNFSPASNDWNHFHSDQVVIIKDNDEEDKTYSISVKSNGRDIADLRKGIITRDNFMEKIEIDELEVSEFYSEDMELVVSIFRRLYKSDLSATYFVNNTSKLYYERIADIGVNFFMKVYSSNQHGDRYNLPTLDLNDLSLSERNKVVNDTYPKFLRELRENILEYGRVIKSMEKGEIINFTVDLTECDNCEMPEEVELSIPFEVIQSYEDGNMTLDQAVIKFEIREY